MHRASIVTRADYDSYWSLPIWRKPNVKVRVVKCAVCNPKQNPRKAKRIARFERKLLQSECE